MIPGPPSCTMSQQACEVVDNLICTILCVGGSQLSDARAVEAVPHAASGTTDAELIQPPSERPTSVVHALLEWGR